MYSGHAQSQNGGRGGGRLNGGGSRELEKRLKIAAFPGMNTMSMIASLWLKAGLSHMDKKVKEKNVSLAVQKGT